MIQWFRSLYIRLRVWLERDPWQSALPAQVPPPGSWRCWLFVGGRGAGKTWAGVKWVVERAKHRHGPILIAAHTHDYLRDVIVDELVVQSPSWFKPTYTPSRRQIVWPNGVVAHLSRAGTDIPRVLARTIWCENLSMWDQFVVRWTAEVQSREYDDLAQTLITTNVPSKGTPHREFVDHLRRLEGPEIRLSRASVFDNPHLPQQ